MYISQFVQVASHRMKKTREIMILYLVLDATSVELCLHRNTGSILWSNLSFK